MNRMIRFLPFLRWFPISRDTLRADLLAGITVALILIPQSRAYGQLAGMPAYYGLYAAFLPVAVAAMWGSSHQLGTGPVAVVSLLTASSLAAFATPGSDQFVALAVMLALLVGLIQLVLGVFKLGVIVNFLSHPVISGFINAAAIQRWGQGVVSAFNTYVARLKGLNCYYSNIISYLSSTRFRASLLAQFLSLANLGQ